MDYDPNRSFKTSPQAAIDQHTLNLTLPRFSKARRLHPVKLRKSWNVTKKNSQGASVHVNTSSTHLSAEQAGTAKSKEKVPRSLLGARSTAAI